MSKKITLKPLQDRVLVEALSEHERGKETKSGIFIPETAEKERAERGTVIAVGPGKMNDEGKIIPMSVTVGDKVIFSKYGPDEIKVDGKEYFILSETNILAIVTE
ncbi:MAG: co-chaperone GroES [bacterium]